MTSASARGRIAYLDDRRRETGNEYFSFTRYPDGSRTVRAECHFDDIQLVRDVTLTLGPDWRPRDAYLRVNHLGHSLGSGWFRFGANAAHCHCVDANGDYHEFVRHYTGSVPAFGAHPIVNDGLWTALFDLRRPNETQRLTDCITYSKEAVGNASIAIETFDLDIRYLGEAQLQVPAGRFQCRSFSVQLLGLEAPFLIWTCSDDYVVVKESWAQMPFTYELAEWQPLGR